MSRLVEFVPATREHALALAERLRAGDLAELQAAGLRPHKTVWRAFRGSQYCKTGLVDGEVGVVYGIGTSPLSYIGRTWMLTTPAAEKMRVALVRQGRKEVAQMLSICPVLVGTVDATYLRALMFLEALGFSIGKEFPFGPYGMPFREYRMERR